MPGATSGAAAFLGFRKELLEQSGSETCGISEWALSSCEGGLQGSFKGSFNGASRVPLKGPLEGGPKRASIFVEGGLQVLLGGCFARARSLRAVQSILTLRTDVIGPSHGVTQSAKELCLTCSNRQVYGHGNRGWATLKSFWP